MKIDTVATIAGCAMAILIIAFVTWLQTCAVVFVVNHFWSAGWVVDLSTWGAVTLSAIILRRLLRAARAPKQ